MSRLSLVHRQFKSLLEEMGIFPCTAMSVGLIMRRRMDRLKSEKTSGMPITCPAATDNRATRSADVTGLSYMDKIVDELDGVPRPVGL
ncbi:hypothetical protein TNCV_102591 [Trichonephila clavipes]|nr:hypothetical protein TNCV_102591 [Trichonephila clavipes]